jgi:AraC-like DNA-binding protein
MSNDKPGRRQYIIDLIELKNLMTFYPTLEETASWFQCSPDTIERRIKEEFSQTFATFRKLHSGKTRLLLKRKAISKALEEDNEKFLIYCLRTMTDLDDRQKLTNSTPEMSTIELSFVDKDL